MIPTEQIEQWLEEEEVAERVAADFPHGVSDSFIVTMRNNWRRVLDDYLLLMAIRKSQSSMITRLTKENEAIKAQLREREDHDDFWESEYHAANRAAFDFEKDRDEWKQRAEKLATTVDFIGHECINDEFCPSREMMQVTARKAMSDYRASIEGEKSG